MTMIINIPGIASAGVDWDVLPVVPSDFPLDGLASYLAVQGATLDASDNIAAMAQWYGADSFVQPNALTAPEIVTVSDVELMRFTRASSERLVSPPAPGGGALLDHSTDGFTVAFPMMLRNTTTSLQGICRFFGIGLRLVVSGGTLLQVGEIDGTSTSANISWDFTALTVVGVAFKNSPSKSMKVYRNGVNVYTSSASTWSMDTTQAAVIGAFFTGSDFGDLDAGDVARWTRQLNDAEMLAASQFLMGRFGIA